MFRSVAGSHPDDAALSVLATLLADEPSGRLYKALVETKKAASVSGHTSGFAEAGTGRALPRKCVRTNPSRMRAQSCSQVLDDLKKNPPTDAEVQSGSNTHTEEL
jgi:zinc protease